MITAADDYPLHQTSRPFRDPGTDRNLYDRFFFNGYPVSGEDSGHQFFAVAFGQYPGRNVMDGAFSVICDGVQHNVRGSRLLGDDRLNLQAGPIKVEILEPLKSLRVTVHALEAGIRADLTFVARSAAFEEPHYRYAPGNLTVFDITRLTQNGTWSGWIEVAGRDRIVVEPDTWRGTRDRSWGIRGVGGTEPNLAPDGPPAQFYWLWAPLNFPDNSVLFDVNERSDGSKWHESAMVSEVGSEGTCTASGTHTYEIDWRPGTRIANGFEMELHTPTGDLSIKLESLLTFYMHGIGYTHPTWRHGMYVGPNEQTHDSYRTDEVDNTVQMFQHVQILSRATRSDGEIGMGILEMYIVGPHAPSGFSGYVDTHA